MAAACLGTEARDIVLLQGEKPRSDVKGSMEDLERQVFRPALW
jgi:hypothetical protein